MNLSGCTMQDDIESGYSQRCQQVSILQVEIDWRERQHVPVPAYILDQYDDAVKRAGAYASHYGFDFDVADYVA